MHTVNDKDAHVDQSQQKSAEKERYHHGDLRAALIEGTRRLVEEKGPDHFSVAEVARAAGVSSAAPYRHFRDKDEIIAEVCKGGMERHYEQMVRVASEYPKGSVDRVRRLGQLYVAFAQAEPGVFRLIFGSAHKPDAVEELKGREIDTFGFVVAQVADVLGRAPDDPEAVRRAFILWTFVHGLSFLLIDDNVRYAGIHIDVEALLADVGQRVLRDVPSA